ncbi:hypothetical protein AMBR_CKHPCMOK_02052 [Lacticaseibacillus rhamnosus]|uniref:D-ribose pyranase n=2 Tax=Lacticaseibacillus rhamnosus TaxID=47715 RepID=A0A6N2XWU1_LACRH|nr:conserved hypothetical protein [Lacticaseibacillus rhamnosus GG]VTU57777.1 hypothetical protein AMBR_BLFENHAL_02680 [Lacticaseibacillus rhamnosus]VTU58810.1 hypothetical protein AMBR_NBBOBCOC_02509 [Lacticaseibacillus rhamnosus]VTU66757.1 hypothetical protein AMBR_CKHPCMOK_02052 [Lacticaseibacillus rhamnosus]VTU68218.1 hypothetical protein AMBR_EADFOONE_02491 [Lacticaseibacillus rhamnosus]
MKKGTVINTQLSQVIADMGHFDGKTIKKNIESPLSLVTTEDANK